MRNTPAEFRRALGWSAAGITVIPVAHEGEIHGMTVTAFTPVTIAGGLLGAGAPVTTAGVVTPKPVQ